MKTTVLQACMLRGAAALLMTASACAWAEQPGYLSRWQSEVSAAGWSSGVSGNAQVGNIPDAKYSEQSSKPNSGFASMEVGQDDSGLLIDAFHSNLAQDSDLLAGGKFGNARIEGTHNVVQVAGAARMSGYDPELLIDFVGGIRYGSVEVEQRLQGLAPCSDKMHWTNGFVGMRVLQKLSERWWMAIYADGGGGGGAQSFLAKLGADYRLTDNASFKFGYQVLGMKSEKQDFTYNLRTGGLYAGLGMRF